MEQHASAEHADIEVILLFFDEVNELLKRRLALCGLEDVVVDGHGLRSLAVAGSEHRVLVDEILAHGSFPALRKRAGKRRLLRHIELIKQKRGFIRHVL